MIVWIEQAVRTLKPTDWTDEDKAESPASKTFFKTYKDGGELPVTSTM